MSLDAKLYNELQEALNVGWLRFRTSKDYASYREFFERHLRDVGFDHSALRKVIPNPAYHLGSQVLGREFLQILARNGITSTEIFPGEFSQSIELENPDKVVREFTMSLYLPGQKLVKISIQFAHLHDEFDFVEPPQFRVVT